MFINKKKRFIENTIAGIVLTFIYMTGAYLVSSFVAWDFAVWNSAAVRIVLLISVFFATKEAWKD